MNHYIKARTNRINCDGTAQELKVLQQMFPPHPMNDNDLMEALLKYFNPNDPQHIRFLKQCCFKVPLADLSQVYDNFRKQTGLKVEQPRISNYFTNENFASLRTLEKWLDGNANYPSLDNGEGMKDQIAQALLDISEEYGYVPNLQRLLLYYPDYLLKVLKVKDRYFEQKSKETQQVNNVNPKNCCFAGLIAAIQAGCPYMISRMTNMFLIRDGSPSWITQRKYPQQFKPLFNLFRKIAVAPWSLNQSDLDFGTTAWDKQIYFDYITAGMYVISMSTICLAIGLIPDQPTKFIPIQQMIKIKNNYDLISYDTISHKNQVAQEVKELILADRQLSKEQIQQIEGKQVQPYMKEIGIKLSQQDLYKDFNKLFNFMDVPQFSPINMKAKNNSFFHRYRESIDKGLEEQRKSDKQDVYIRIINDFQQVKLVQQSFGKSQQNTRIFRKSIQVMTENLCGFHNQVFDYKKNIKLNMQLTMPTRFYVRLLSISPLYINQQVLLEVIHDRQKGWAGCFDLGNLAIMVAQNKAKLLMTSIQSQLLN